MCGQQETRREGFPATSEFAISKYEVSAVGTIARWIPGTWRVYGSRRPVE